MLGHRCWKLNALHLTGVDGLLLEIQQQLQRNRSRQAAECTPEQKNDKLCLLSSHSQNTGLNKYVAGVSCAFVSVQSL